MPLIALDLIDAHPDNANHMPEHLLRKLIAHIVETDAYPPLIVRPHPAEGGRYQLLDGHHRAIALRRLERSHANCDIWHVDDAQADMLLLTLNRLHGEDDPQRRGLLLERLSHSISIENLADALPDSVEQINRLITLTQPPPPPSAPPPVSDMPHPVTFFLTDAQRRSLLARLREVDADRTTALLALLGLH